MQNLLDLQIRLGLHFLVCTLDSFIKEIRDKNIVLLTGYQQTPLLWTESCLGFLEWLGIYYRSADYCSSAILKRLAPAPGASLGDAGSTPGLRRSPGEGNGNPLQYSCLENPIDRRSPMGSSPWSHRRVRHGLVTEQQVPAPTRAFGHIPLLLVLSLHPFVNDSVKDACKSWRARWDLGA